MTSATRFFTRSLRHSRNSTPATTPRGGPHDRHALGTRLARLILQLLISEWTKTVTSTVRRGLRKLVGIWVVEGEAGDAVSHLTVTEDHLNGGGILHGGAIAMMCDSAMGHAVGSLIYPAQSASTATLNITFLNRAELGDDLVTTAKVRKRGKRIVVVEASVIRTSDETPIADAVATFGTRERRT